MAYLFLELAPQLEDRQPGLSPEETHDSTRRGPDERGPREQLHRLRPQVPEAELDGRVEDDAHDHDEPLSRIASRISCWLSLIYSVRCFG